MEKKIIELTKDSGGFDCILCCENEATTKVMVNRVKYDDSIVGFYVCDQCLAKMKDDIQKTCE